MQPTLSKPYDRKIVVLHWSAAAAIALTLASGFAAGSSTGAAAGALQAHIAVGVTVGAMTVTRLAILRRGRRRAVGDTAASGAVPRLAALVHRMLYVVPLVLVFSGIAMLLRTGAPGDLVLGTVPMPAIAPDVPRRVHGFAALVLPGLIALHVAAAFWHQIVRRDRIMHRMGLSR